MAYRRSTFTYRETTLAREDCCRLRAPTSYESRSGLERIVPFALHHDSCLSTVRLVCCTPRHLPHRALLITFVFRGFHGFRPYAASEDLITAGVSSPEVPTECDDETPAGDLLEHELRQGVPRGMNSSLIIWNRNGGDVTLEPSDGVNAAQLVFELALYPRYITIDSGSSEQGSLRYPIPPWGNPTLIRAGRGRLDIACPRSW
ncbi:hypothetical protein FA13DRAFT_1475147 [Coprinellus micaceus]|uniref:Uncharacterized protein n=1 Tax=Coprinellus micaceus TaxID=71717 RepID=A0A4Y7SLE1_COPMI|nr:hypothetical protein FA13DRAFT_1475147 [Coprinellus micaceus]